MEALSLVLTAVFLFYQAVITIKQDLENPLFAELIGKDCELVGFQLNRGTYIPINPFHPNSIGVGCLFLAGLSMYSLYFNPEKPDWVLIYLVAAFGDAVDGMIARRCNLETEFGKKFDPLRDKLTYLLFLGYFSIYGYFTPIANVALLVFSIFEIFGQFVVRWILEKRGRSTSANIYGKVKATIAFSMPPYIYVVSHDNLVPDFTSELMIVCTVMSILSVVTKIMPKKTS